MPDKAPFTETDTEEPKGFYVPSGWGSVWLPRMRAGRATCSVVGDSQEAGYVADLKSNGYVGRVAAAVQAKYGDGGSGYFSVERSVPVNATAALFSDKLALTGTWVGNATGKTGPGMQSLTNAAVGSTMTIPVRGTTIKIYWLRSAGTLFNLQVDGGAVIPVDTTGVVGIGITTIDGLAAGNHTLLIGSNDTVVIYGATGENDSGIIFNNFAQGGAVTTNMDLQGAGAGLEAGRWSGGASYPADLTIYGFLVNDAFIAMTPLAVALAVRQYMNHVREDHDTDILFVAKHCGQLDNATPGFHNLVNQQRQIAETYGAAFINIWTTYNNNYRDFLAVHGWGDDSVGTGVPGNGAAHPGNIGHQLWADLVTPIVMGSDSRFKFA